MLSSLVRCSRLVEYALELMRDPGPHPPSCGASVRPRRFGRMDAATGGRGGLRRLCMSAEAWCAAHSAPFM